MGVMSFSKTEISPPTSIPPDLEFIATLGLFAKVFCSSSFFSIFGFCMDLSSVLNSRGRCLPNCMIPLSSIFLLTSCGDTPKLFKIPLVQIFVFWFTRLLSGSFFVVPDRDTVTVPVWTITALCRCFPKIHYRCLAYCSLLYQFLFRCLKLLSIYCVEVSCLYRSLVGIIVRSFIRNLKSLKALLVLWLMLFHVNDPSLDSHGMCCQDYSSVEFFGLSPSSQGRNKSLGHSNLQRC